jgi:hypothetical protein
MKCGFYQRECLSDIKYFLRNANQLKTDDKYTDSELIGQGSGECLC